MKAYRIQLNDHFGIVFAETSAKARWLAVSSYREAYSSKGFPLTLLSKRVPEYDKYPDSFSEGCEHFWKSCFLNENEVRGRLRS